MRRPQTIPHASIGTTVLVGLLHPAQMSERILVRITFSTSCGIHVWCNSPSAARRGDSWNRRSRIPGDTNAMRIQDSSRLPGEATLPVSAGTDPS